MKLTKLPLIFIFSFVFFTACSSERSSSQVSTTTSLEINRDPSLPGQFLFSSSLPGDRHMVTEHIFVMNEDGTEKRQLTDDEFRLDFDAVWSPDNLQIAFSRLCDGCSDSGLYVMNADGTGLRQLFEKNIRGPQWSPDGQQILFTGQTYSYGVWNQIFVINVDGTGLRQFHPYNGYNSFPVWSPDGTRISFDSDQEAGRYIYVVNADGTEVSETFTRKSGRPVWSPDGQRIAFEVYEDYWSHIFVMNADGSEVTKVTDDYLWNGSPSWSPDGSRIAFDRWKEDDHANVAVFVVNADGSDLQKIISKAHTPMWSSTSEHIAFHDFADPSWFNSSGGLILRGGGMSVVTANGTLIHSTGTSTDSFDWNG